MFVRKILNERMYYKHAILVKLNHQFVTGL